jgi:hypothetical protein
MLYRHLSTALRLSALMALGVGATACAATLGPPLPPPEVETTASSIVTAQISSFTANTRGLMDGVVLDDGTRVHFRPHMGTTLLPLLTRGDRIRVTGWEMDRGGGRVLEAKTITNLRTNTAVDVSAFADPPPPHAPSIPPGAIAPPEPAR